MNSHLLAVSSGEGRREGVFWGLFYKGTNLIHEGATLMTLITSQRLHLQIPSPWELGQNINFGGHKHSVHSSHRAWNFAEPEFQTSSLLFLEESVLSIPPLESLCNFSLVSLKFPWLNPSIQKRINFNFLFLQNTESCISRSQNFCSQPSRATIVANRNSALRFGLTKDKMSLLQNHSFVPK